MNIYSKVAVALCVLLMATLMSETSSAQTRITASQLRAAQLRAAQQRAAQTRSTTIRPTTTRRTAQVRRVVVPAPAATKSTTSTSVTPKDQIPEAALLTERGTELVDRLKRLRYTESQMGSRHPSLEDVQNQIASVKQELQAWVPAIKTKSDDAEEDDVETAERALAQLNEEDLRQLVVRLSMDVYKLRNRVVELESQQEKISNLVSDRE